MYLSRLIPHAVNRGLTETVLNGMRISAVPPSGSIRLFASQMPSHPRE